MEQKFYICISPKKPLYYYLNGTADFLTAREQKGDETYGKNRGDWTAKF